MRSSKAEIEKRRENIITYLLENGESNIEDIASYLSISTLTVRRYLRIQGESNYWSKKRQSEAE